MKWNPFSQSYSPVERQMLEFLKHCPLFSQLTDRQLYHFLPYTFERKYRKKEVVFFRNDPSQALYVIRSGKVALTLDVDQHFESLGWMEEYGFFGENSLLTDTKRIYNAISDHENTVLNIIPTVHIHEIFDDHPKIKAKMLDALCIDFNYRYSQIFKEYKSSRGFFELGQVFGENHKAQ